MKNKEYIEKVLTTESNDWEAISERISPKGSLRLLHGSMGIATEAGELLDAVKKHIFYGSDLDKVNLIEEIGDILWYLSILVDELGISLEDSMKKNIKKLESRYGSSFSEKGAQKRDLNKERKILED